LLDKPTSGKIFVDGEEITAKGSDVARIRRKMGMVFQHFNLFPHMTVIENIMAAPMDLLGLSKQEAYDRRIELLRKVGLADKALNYPDVMSGGQKQRVAIARALAMEPEIILFDEPTSALDPTMIGEVQAVIRDLAKQGITMIIVTHEMKFAREICNRVFYMDEGGVYEDGTPEQIFDDPQKERTRRFIRHLKVLEYSITSQNFDFIGFNTQIEEFGRKHRISQRKIYHMQAYIEEMCVQMILPQMRAPFEMLVTVEYSEEKDDVAVVIRYGGAAFDPTKTDNTLSLLLAKKATENIVYSFDGEQALCNRVDAQI
jgi:polar amino acid transport system ATP-binding protein